MYSHICICICTIRLQMFIHLYICIWLETRLYIFIYIYIYKYIYIWIHAYIWGIYRICINIFLCIQYRISKDTVPQDADAAIYKSYKRKNCICYISHILDYLAHILSNLWLLLLTTWPLLLLQYELFYYYTIHYVIESFKISHLILFNKRGWRRAEFLTRFCGGPIVCIL